MKINRKYDEYGNNDNMRRVLNNNTSSTDTLKLKKKILNQ